MLRCPPDARRGANDQTDQSHTCLLNVFLSTPEAQKFQQPYVTSTSASAGGQPPVPPPPPVPGQGVQPASFLPHVRRNPPVSPAVGQSEQPPRSSLMKSTHAIRTHTHLIALSRSRYTHARRCLFETYLTFVIQVVGLSVGRGRPATASPTGRIRRTDWHDRTRLSAVRIGVRTEAAKHSSVLRPGERAGRESAINTLPALDDTPEVTWSIA